MLFYNDFCCSSACNFHCLLICLFLIFYRIINNTFPLSSGIFLSSRTVFVITHRNLTSAWFSCNRTHCVRRFERSNCGCTGVSLSDRTGHGEERGQIFLMDADSGSLAYIRSWRIGSKGSLIV